MRKIERNTNRPKEWKAKKALEEHQASSIQGKNKSFLKYVRSRKPARKATGLLDREGGKGEIKGDLEEKEKLNELLASLFTAEGLGHVLLSKRLVSVMNLHCQKAFGSVHHQRLLRKLQVRELEGRSSPGLGAG